MLAAAMARIRRGRLVRRCTSPGMRALLESDFPDPSRDWREAGYLAVDLETTGLNVASAQIVSIGWVPIDGGEILLSGAAHHLVRGEGGVGQSAAIHRITDTHRANGVEPGVAMESLLGMLAGRVLVLHHARLDHGLLSALSRALYGVSLCCPVIDTLELERQHLQNRALVPVAEGLRLGACRLRYGLPDYPAHDALSDSLATAELLLAQLCHMEGRQKLRLRQIPAYRP